MDSLLKVYLDCSPLTNPQVSGIGVYNKNLFLELRKELKDDVYPVLKWSRLKHSETVRHHIYENVKPLAPILLSKKTIYHGTDHKLNTRSLGPTVVTIHDMQPFEGKWMDPNFAKGRTEIMTRVLQSNVDKIIAVSQFTKNEIIKYFPKVAPKIEVVYHGYNFEDSRIDLETIQPNSIKDIAQGRPFLFFIGNIEERKNLINQIKAFEILKESEPDLIFIVAGRAGFNFEEIVKYMALSRYSADIYGTGYLSEEEKAYALKHTVCLMFASWYEGFGIPVIEALAKNTNLVISQSSSLEEIGREYCYQCNPADPEDIANKVATVMKKGNLQKVNLDTWKNDWSWKKCALGTIDVYKKLL
jgi:glycosyltransferase involved in cell wall biosynthesis